MMPTLSQGASASVAVTNGQYVSLKNGANDNARIELAAGVAHKVNHNGAAVYGPFTAQTLKIAALKGSVAYAAGSLASVAPMGRL